MLSSAWCLLFGISLEIASQREMMLGEGREQVLSDKRRISIKEKLGGNIKKRNRTISDVNSSFQGIKGTDFDLK